jgi:hypothetical protein
MTTHGSAAKAARERKAAHPDKFCANARCLWRLSSGPCPKHPSEPKPTGAARLPVKGERVEYRAGFESPIYRGIATGERCADGDACTAIHVLADGREPIDVHHIPRDYFAAGEAHARWARVLDGETQAKEGR